MSDSRPHLAGLVEDRWNLGLAGVLGRRGWRHRVLAHSATATPSFLRILARVILAPPTYDPKAGDALLQRRGWRNFVTAEALDTPVTVTDRGTTATRSARTGPATSTRGCPTPGWHPAGRR